MRQGFLYIIIAKIVWIVSGFTIHVGLGRLLGPKTYGIFGIIISLISISYIILGNGMRQAITKYTANDLKLAGSIKITGLKIQTIFSLIIGVGLLLLSRPIAILLGDDTLSNFIKLSALTILPIGILFVYVGSIEGIKQFGKSATISITYAVLKVICVFLLVLLGLEVYGAILGLILSVSLTALVGGYFSRGQPNDGHFDYALLIKFAVPVLSFFVAIAMLMHIDILFAKSLLADNTKIGFYTSAQALSRVIYFVFAAFSVVLLPSVSTAIANNNLALIKKYTRQSLRYMVMLLVPTNLIISATSDQLITLFYGTAYAEAAYPLSILVFGISFLSITLALSTIIQGYGEPKTPLVIFSILVPLDVFLLLLMIPKFELLGAALATSITCFVGLVISFGWIYNKLKTLFSARSLVKMVSASIIAYLIVRNFSLTGILLPGYYICFFAFYFFILFILKEINGEDRSLVSDLFGKFQRKRIGPELIP